MVSHDGRSPHATHSFASPPPHPVVRPPSIYILLKRKLIYQFSILLKFLEFLFSTVPTIRWARQSSHVCVCVCDACVLLRGGGVHAVNVIWLFFYIWCERSHSIHIRIVSSYFTHRSANWKIIFQVQCLTWVGDVRRAGNRAERVGWQWMRYQFGITITITITVIDNNNNNNNKSVLFLFELPEFSHIDILVLLLSTEQIHTR